MSSVLPREEVRRRLRERGVKGWRIDGRRLRKTFQFKDFPQAVEFVNKLKEVAERAKHHPDICVIAYRRVRVSLTTHDAGGLTEKDVEVASGVEQTYKEMTKGSEAG